MCSGKGHGYTGLDSVEEDLTKGTVRRPDGPIKAYFLDFLVISGRSLTSDGKVSGSHREVFPLVSYDWTAISAGNFSWNGYFNDEGEIPSMP